MANRPVMWSPDHEAWVQQIAKAVEAQSGENALYQPDIRLANGKVNVSTVIVVATRRFLRDLSSDKVPSAKRFDALVQSYLTLRTLEQIKKVYISEDTEEIIAQILAKLQTSGIKVPHATHGGKANRRLIITLSLQYVAELPQVKKA